MKLIFETFCVYMLRIMKIFSALYYEIFVNINKYVFCHLANNQCYI